METIKYLYDSLSPLMSFSLVFVISVVLFFLIGFVGELLIEIIIRPIWYLIILIQERQKHKELVKHLEQPEQ